MTEQFTYVVSVAVTMPVSDETASVRAALSDPEIKARIEAAMRQALHQAVQALATTPRRSSVPIVPAPGLNH